jgi:hypothetical protein
MMKMKPIFAVLAVLSLPTTILASGGIREGMWEITSSMEMPGTPMKMPPTTVKHCYTKEDAKDQKRVIIRDKNCTLTDFTTSGNKVSWKMKCTGNRAGTFSGETLFSGDSYESIMKMQADAAKGKPMTMRVKGKRVGTCP